MGLSPPVRAATIIQEQAYEEVRDLVQDHLLVLCPSAKNHIVIVGEKAVPVLAFLQNLGVRHASALSLNYVALVAQSVHVESSPRAQRSLYGRTFDEIRGSPSAQDRELLGELTPNRVRNAIWAHFDRFLPQPKHLGRRGLCLVEAMATGLQFESLRQLVEEYYDGRYGKRPRLTVISLENLPTTPQSGSVDRTIYLAPGIATQMSDGEFGRVTPHLPFYPPVYFVRPLKLAIAPSSESPPSEPRLAYVYFRREMQEMMQADPRVRRRVVCVDELEAED